MESNIGNKNWLPSQHTGLSQFVRKAAHDIANPLNAILMNAELAKLMLERDQTGPAQETLARLIGDCKRTAKLLRDMRAFGSDLQIDSRDFVELRNLIDDAIGAATMEGVQVPAETDVSVENIAIRVDCAAFQRLILALLRNAVEAGATSIQIRATQDAGTAAIDFCDNGGGITEDLREKVFGAFFTTRRNSGNSGLGLTLVRAIVSDHHGDVTIESGNGSGTLIRLSMPTESSRQAN